MNFSEGAFGEHPNIQRAPPMHMTMPQNDRAIVRMSLEETHFGIMACPLLNCYPARLFDDVAICGMKSLQSASG
jgi:hypothetical protein